MATYTRSVKQVEDNHFSPLYLLHGEEKYLHESFIALLVNNFLQKDADFGLIKLDGNSVNLEEVFNQLDAGDLFSRRRIIVVENPHFLAASRKSEKGEDEHAARQPSETDLAAQELLVVFLDNLNRRQPEKIIVLSAGKVDRRKKIYKLIDQKAAVVECLPLKGEELARWIRQKAQELGKSINRDAVERLLLAGDHNLHYLATELSKYSAYLGQEEDSVTAEVVDRLFSGDLQGDVFKLADALAEKKFSRAEKLLQLLLSRREKPLLIFFLLVRHYRLLLQARGLLDEGLPAAQFARALEVQHFVARKLQEQAAFYTRVALEEALLIFQHTDYQIKTGCLEPEAALYLLLSRIDSLQTVL